MSAKRVLFCRSGGGFPGVDIHMGIWLALRDAGIESTHNCGTSAGAIVSAMDSAGHGVDWCRDFLEKLTDRDVRRERFAWKLRMLWIDWFLSPKPILKTLARVFETGSNFYEKPLTVFSADELSGASISHNEADKLCEPIYASMAIPGVFPPVIRNGRRESDGGLVNYCAIPRDWATFDQVWVLIAAPPYDYVPQSSSIMSRLLTTTSIMLQNQITRDVESMTWPYWVHVIRTNVGTESSMLRFDHSLIEAARKDAAQQIAKQLPAGT